MKTLKLTLSIIVIAFLVCGNILNAQTIQKELRSTFTNINAYCLNRPISGEFVYIISYHLDRKTGKVDRIHWNASQSDVWDAETGEKYKLIDSGHDNYGPFWESWNNINNYVDNKYNVENGWLPVPDELPSEGSVVGMSFKFIGKGGNVFGMKFMWQLHINAKGEVTVDRITEYADCN